MNPRLILCSEWRQLLSEVRRQLKPHKLTVTATVIRGSDLLKVDVGPLVTPAAKAKAKTARYDKKADDRQWMHDTLHR